MQKPRDERTMHVQTYPVRNRGDWLAMRRQDVTASEVAALFGAHPYKTALQVYAEKMGPGRAGGDNAAMRRGRILEPGCIVALQEERPDWEIHKADHYLRLEDHRIGATPDYFRHLKPHETPNGLGTREIIECKTVSPEKWAEWQGGVPLAYQLQVVVQCKLAACKRGWIALLVDNRAKDFELFEVPAHDGAWKRILEKVTEFWEAVEAGALPNPDYSRDREALKTLLPPIAGQGLLDWSADNYTPALLAERETLADQVKTGKARIDAIDAEIVDKLNGAEGAMLPGWKIAHKMQSRKEFTVAASEFPVLRVSKTKEKDFA
jgi:putative phage-type endonuclease